MGTIFHSNTETLFAAHTSEGHVFKQLSELLQNNMRTAYFAIDKDTIELRMVDHHQTILIDLKLISENFAVYKFNMTEKLNIGLNLSHLYKMLRNAKKKDSIILFIEKNRPNDLGIQLIPKENNRITTSYIKIQNSQNLSIQLPEGYCRPVNVPSSDYQKTCKDMNSISNTIHVHAQGFQIRLFSDAGAVYSKEVVFGTEIRNIQEYDNEEYKGKFDTEKLIKITKVSGLSNNIKIYYKQGLPLLFKSNVGSLGDISIYIKSKEDIDNEQRNDDYE